jgi:hypothetical protein
LAVCALRIASGSALCTAELVSAVWGGLVVAVGS